MKTKEQMEQMESLLLERLSRLEGSLKQLRWELEEGKVSEHRVSKLRGQMRTLEMTLEGIIE